MKRKLLSLLLAFAMLLPCLPAASAAEEQTNWAGDDGIIKVLAIGSSYTKDSFYFFDDVERAQDPDDEIKMVVGYLYEGGVSVPTHASNATKDKEAYIYYKYDRTKNKDFTEVKSTTRNALLDEDWDLISIQQSPFLSSDDGKESGLDTLVDFIRTNATNPKVKLGRHFSWSYHDCYQYMGPRRDGFIRDYSGNGYAMYQDIVRYAQNFEQTHPEFEFMVPSATVIQNLRGSILGNNLQRDNYHLNSHGRFMIAYSWFSFLTGKPLDSIKMTKSYWNPTQTERAAMIEAINNALANPYQVTPATITTPDTRPIYYVLDARADEGGEVRAYDLNDPSQIVTVKYAGRKNSAGANLFCRLTEDGILESQTLFNLLPNVGYHNYFYGYNTENQTLILADGTASMGGHTGTSSCGFTCTPTTSNGGQELPFYVANTPTTTPVFDITGEDHGLKTLQDVINLSATHRIRMNHYSYTGDAPKCLLVDEVVSLETRSYELKPGDVIFIPGTVSAGSICEAYIMQSATAEVGEKVSVSIPTSAFKLADGLRANTVGRFWEMVGEELKLVNGKWYSHKKEGDPTLAPYRYGYHNEVLDYGTGMLLLGNHPKHYGYGKKCGWNFAKSCGSTDDERGLLCAFNLKRTSAMKIIDLRADVLAGKVAPLSTVAQIQTQCEKHDDVMVNTFVPDGTKEGGTATALIVLDSTGTFTRGEVVQALYEKAGQPKVTAEVTFTDVPADSPYYNAVSWAANQKYVAGYGDGTFGPDKKVTMEQLAVILWHYMGCPEDDVSLSEMGEHSRWALDALHWALARKVFINIPYGKLSDGAPRVETVQMLTDYLK